MEELDWLLAWEEAWEPCISCYRRAALPDVTERELVELGAMYGPGGEYDGLYSGGLCRLCEAGAERGRDPSES